MTQPTAAPAARLMHSARTGASRKLLARKAKEKSSAALAVDGVESTFPVTGSDAALIVTPASVAAPTHELTVAAKGAKDPVYAPAPLEPTATPQVVPTWSDEDETAFKILSAQRKAAGYRTRGRDVGAQLITVGNIKPNPGTVVAVIVGMVAERGNVPRSLLIEAMAAVTFPHPKAQPTDKGWCQGYVAGAIRNGFLSAYDATSTALQNQAV